MALYIALNNFTDQGVRNIKDTAKRSDAVRDMAKKLGVTVKEVFWTMGSYDTVIVFDAPDDAAAAAVVASIGAAGNLRTMTLRAFSQAEINEVLAKMA